MGDIHVIYTLLKDLCRWVLEFQIPHWVMDNKLVFLDTFIERAEAITTNNKTNNFNKDNPFQLSCIFNHLLVQEEIGASPTLASPFQALSIDKDAIFPGTGKGDYQQLCRDFKEEFQRLPGGPGNEKIFVDTLYYLLKKYTSYLPVSEELAYIQLFEFLKVRSAFALALYEYEIAESKEAFPFILYCIDQSGIQSFLYNITSNKAAKSLKGRSFYLQLLMESLTQKLINTEELKANLTSVLYSSGGKTYFILPNTEGVQAALVLFEQEILLNLKEEHQLELYLCTGQVKFGWGKGGFSYEQEDGSHKYGEGIGALWKLLSERTRKKSQQRYIHLLSGDYDNFFAVNGADGFDVLEGSKKVCAVTGETVNVSDEKDINIRRKLDMIYHNKENEGDDPVWVLEQVKRQSELGYSLQFSDFYKTFYPEKKITPEHKKRLFSPIELETPHGFAGEEEIEDELTKLQQLYSFNKAIIKKINDPKLFLPDDAHQTLPKGDQSAYGFSFYGGNRQAYYLGKYEQAPKKKLRNAVKDFSQLAGLDNEADQHKGFHRLGVLRMDVDGLGNIFRKGLKNMEYFPAYSTLSAQLDLFFSGYLNTIRKPYEDYLNIIYSGGDDIFAVGKWDCILNFAMDVRKAFRFFVNHREEISISGGVILVPPKFPIAKAAKMAEEAEGIAKQFEWKNEKVLKYKNAICLFDIPISWEGEFDEVHQLKEEMIDLAEKGHLSSGFLQKMIAFQLMKQMAQEERKTKDEWNKQKAEDANENTHQLSKQTYQYLWTSAYFISQYQGRFKSLDQNAPIRQFLEKLKKQFVLGLKNNGRFYDLMGVAARWAELEIRSNKKEKSN